MKSQERGDGDAALPCPMDAVQPWCGAVRCAGSDPEVPYGEDGDGDPGLGIWETVVAQQVR